MSSRRTYTPNDIAHALAALEINGGALRQTARQLGVSVTTLMQWRGATYVQAKQPWSDEIRELWEDSLRQALRASIAIVSQAQDRAWLAQQDAHGVGVLYGIVQDKARALTEAARRAGMDRPQLVEGVPRDDAESADDA